MNDQTILDRQSAREQARIIAGLLTEEINRIQADAREAFWDELKRMVPELASKPAMPPTTISSPFTDAQARAFGRSRVPAPFYKYQGAFVDEVPLNYLEKICEPHPFVVSVQRYLASTRILLESEEPNCDD